MAEVDASGKELKKVNEEIRDVLSKEESVVVKNAEECYGLASGLKKGVGQVTYLFDQGAGSIFKTTRNSSHIFREEDGIREEVLKDVDRVTFSYYLYDKEEKRFIWRSKWEKEGGVPLAITITLSMSYEDRASRFTKTIPVPISDLVVSGEEIGS